MKIRLTLDREPMMAMLNILQRLMFKIRTVGLLFGCSQSILSNIRVKQLNLLSRLGCTMHVLGPNSVVTYLYSILHNKVIDLFWAVIEASFTHEESRKFGRPRFH